MRDFLSKIDLISSKYLTFIWFVPFVFGIVMALCFSWPTLAGYSLPERISDILKSIVSLFLYLPITFLFLFSVIATPISLIVLIIKKDRRILKLTLFLFLTAVLVPAGVIVGTKIRHNNFKRLPIRFQPLINAIEHYQRDKGKYPDALTVLVPDYIEALPTTGMIGYSIYEYRLPLKGSLYNKYELSMFCGAYCFLNSDFFIYWPEGGYPEELWGGWVGQIDKWAYVHSIHQDRN
jgi:hypothetical protein